MRVMFMPEDILYIVIPAYNEEENIEQVVRDWIPIVENINSESRLVVIDDGSKDNTYKKLCELKNEFKQLEAVTKPNGGHGATVLYGYHYALKHNADFIFQTDSDGQTLASEFKSFWYDREKYAAIIGHRNHRKDGFSRIIVTKVLKFVLWCIFGLSITDANAPYRLVKREILEKYITRIPKDFNLSNVMLTVLLVNGKENISFRPITFRPRQGGVNSINLPRIMKIGWQAVKDFSRIKNGLKNL